MFFPHRPLSDSHVTLCLQPNASPGNLKLNGEGEGGDEQDMEGGDEPAVQGQLAPEVRGKMRNLGMVLRTLSLNAQRFRLYRSRSAGLCALTLHACRALVASRVSRRPTRTIALLLRSTSPRTSLCSVLWMVTGHTVRRHWY